MGVQFFYVFGLLLVFSGYLGLLMTRSYVMSMFLCLELMVVGILFLMGVYSVYSVEGKLSDMCLLLLSVKACEASAGLALVVSLSRSHGKTFLSKVNLLIS